MVIFKTPHTTTPTNALAKESTTMACCPRMMALCSRPGVQCTSLGGLPTHCLYSNHIKKQAVVYNITLTNGMLKAYTVKVL